MLTTLLLAAAVSISPPVRPVQPRTAMPAFATWAELRIYLRDFLAERERRRSRMARSGIGTASPLGAMSDAAGAPAAEMGAVGITNNQHAGVDEGGIVKMVGNHLVVLRRGRLFTVAVGAGELRPVSAEDAFGPNISPSGTWYDEMLISGDKVVVIGYSYERGGTEVGIFRLGGDGSLRYLSTFQLRSNDYYSSRNYAARLIGTRLVFYAPLYLPWGSDSDLSELLPAMQRWNGRGSGFRTIARPSNIYRPAGWEPTDDAALHTVTSCELAAAQPECSASVVLGPSGRVFYVSQSAVYVWMNSWMRSDTGARRASAMLTRIPLDGGRPTAIGVAGAPVDQFSFMESADGHLNVLTRANGGGEAMWGSENSGGRAALLRLPLSRLGNGADVAPASMYRPLATPPGYTFQNRFVGDYLIYGAGNGWGRQRAADSTLYLVPWRGGEAYTVALTHGTDRIEVLGTDAVVVGVRGNNLEFSGIRLRGVPAIQQRFVLPQASQGETRSHGFFYRVDGDDSGVLGLPVTGANRPGWRQLVEGSASVLFLRNNGRRFTELGMLDASALRNNNDGCRASCADWYGNARPIFARGRVFALMGYEIVEGSIAEGAITEVRRVNFASALMAAR